MSKRLCNSMFSRFGMIDAVMEIELRIDPRYYWSFVRTFDDIMMNREGGLPYTKTMRDRWTVELGYLNPDTETGYVARRVWKDGTVISAPEKNIIDSGGYLCS